ncbi:filamentous hemagglutinin N-terminal domain-containing protein [Salmonella enterica]|nr:filamentous hemagglutinin N-terminal domain-containing protein [Salmonella enterica]EJM4069278.1 filamentous hemagglutinin N-terminal domain-containing protein [Salmonella enterica]
MNKIYKLKFDKRRNELVVVSEITAGMGKEKSTGHLADLTALSPFRKLLGTLTPLAFLTGLVISLFPGMALANPDLPTGGQIVGGQGSISTSGNQMTIHQQTQNMATNWHSFDIGKNNTVQFVQPDSSSVALNRVTGASGSQIMGTLKANGQVFILNPNGVLFGKDARVNVAGLVASTKNINTADFMKGQYTLSGSGNPGAQVVSQGNLTTSKGGYIVLAGERVSNSGTVTTPDGKAVLAAGKTVTLQLDNGGLTSVSVDGSVVNALVENQGLISASNGQVYLTAKGQGMLLNTVVNNTGTIEAKGLASRGGEIVLNGGDSGVVSQSGQLLADSQSGQGGKVILEGQNIHLAGSSLTSATGKTGGGEVYVGGGWQGRDSRIKNASKVVMDKTATVDVSATDAGNGGTAVLWSDDYTNFRGTVLAKGGAGSGNGGRVETSSHKNLQAFGEVDASAHKGRGGEWLLDPTDVSIVSGENLTAVTEVNPGSPGTLDTGVDYMFRPSGTGAQIGVEKITTQLNRGTSVTVKTSGADVDGQSGNISVNANITKTAGPDATLTLMADGNIVVGGNSDNTAGGRNRTISSSDSGGKLGLKLLAGGTGGSGSITLGRDVNISLNGGDFYAGPGVAGESGSPSVSLLFQNNGKINAGNITMDVAGGMTGRYSSLEAKNDLTVKGPVSVMTGWEVPVNITAGGKLTLTAPSGNITFSSKDTSSGGGKILISGKNGVDIKAQNGSVTLDTNQGPIFGIDVKSDKDITFNATNNSSGYTVSLKGADLESKTGNIAIKGNNSGKNYAGGVYLTRLSATSLGNINVTGNALSGTASGVFLGDSLNLTAGNSTSPARIEISGKSQGILSKEYGLPDAGVYLYGDNSFLSAANIGISGENKRDGYDGGSAGIVIGSTAYSSENKGANFTFDGNTIFNGTGDTHGLVFGILKTNTLSFNNGSVWLNGFETRAYSGGSDVGTGGVTTVRLSGNDGSILKSDNNIKLNNIDKFTIYGVSRNDLTGNPGPGVGSAGRDALKLNFSGGVNNLSVVGSGNRGAAVDTGVLNLSALDVKKELKFTGASNTGAGVLITGGDYNKFEKVVINGTSSSGNNGVWLDNVTLSGADITGTSATGTGVYFNGNTNKLKDVVITGKTSGNNGRGIFIGGMSGSNVKVNGTATTAGDGLNLAGTVILSGDSDMKGISARGRGVFLNGSVDGGAITGETPNGHGGVILANNAKLKDTTVKGESETGKGVYAWGNVTLTGTTVNGTSSSGTGAQVESGAKVTQDGKSSLSGTAKADGGTGVRLSGTVDGGKVTGGATTGSAVELAGGAKVTNAMVNGTATTSGSGVNVTGAVVLDETTAKGLSAASTGTGSGLTLGEGANVSVVKTGTDTAVTTAVVMKGTSESGSAVTVNGNASVTGVALKGETADGTGVTLKSGKLTLSDNISGVEASSTGKGTALVLENATVDAKGYRESEDKEKAKDYTLTALVAGDGTAVKTTGESALISVKLNATSAGNGNGLKVESGTLTSDREITASSEGEQGTAVVLKGGGLQGSGDTSVVVKAGVNKEKGTAVKVEKAESAEGGVTPSSLKNIDLQASSDKGTVLDVGGELHSDRDISVSTADGTALVLNGGGLTSTDTAKPVTITASATGDTGTAVKVEKTVTEEGGQTSSLLKDVILVSSSTKGDALNVAGKLETQNAELKTSASDTGTALNIHDGEIHSQGQTSLTATADAGRAAVITDGKLTGEGDNALVLSATTASENPAVDISGNSDISNSTVKGENKGTGTAVKQSGNTMMANAGVTGTAATGTGTEVTGSVTQNEKSSLSGTAKAGGGTGVRLSGTVDGGNLTGNATNGSAVELAEGAKVANATVNGVASAGAGLSVRGNTTLTDSSVTGTAASGVGLEVESGTKVMQDEKSSLNGKGEGVAAGVQVLGEVSGGNITGDADIGAGVVLQGAALTNVTVNGVSPLGYGVDLLDKVVLIGTSVKGTSASDTGSRVAPGAKVTLDKNSTVDGKATANGGKGVSLAGTVDGGSVTGSATTGSAVELASGAKVKHAMVNGTATTGTGVNVSDGAALNNASLNGTTESGKGMVINGSLTQDATSSVSGNSEGKGTGLVLGGKASVSGGSLTAASVDGTGLQVEKGSRTDNVMINAWTANGKAIGGENNALTTVGSTTISTVGDTGNANIAENVKPVPGGTPSGAVAEALGNKLSENISTLQKALDTKLAALDGLQQTMSTLQMQFDQAVRTGAVGQADLKRLEMAVNALSVRLHTAAELKDAFSALKGDSGSLDARMNKAGVLSAGLQGLTLPAAGDISAVGTELGAAKELHSATVSLQGGLTARLEENENARHLLDNLKQQLKDAQEKGTAGGVVLASMQTQLEELDLQQRSYGDELAHIRQRLVTVSQDGSSPVTSRQESVNGLQTSLSGVSGISDMQVRELGNQLQQATTGYARLVATVQGQEVVNAQTPLQSRDQQDGFHAGGEPSVPVNGYQAQLQNVDISLCDSDGCRIMTLDAGKPSLSQVAAVTESR